MVLYPKNKQNIPIEKNSKTIVLMEGAQNRKFSRISKELTTLKKSAISSL